MQHTQGRKVPWDIDIERLFRSRRPWGRGICKYLSYYPRFLAGCTEHIRSHKAQEDTHRSRLWGPRRFWGQGRDMSWLFHSSIWERCIPHSCSRIGQPGIGILVRPRRFLVEGIDRHWLWCSRILGLGTQHRSLRIFLVRRYTHFRSRWFWGLDICIDCLLRPNIWGLDRVDRILRRCRQGSYRFLYWHPIGFLGLGKHTFRLELIWAQGSIRTGGFRCSMARWDHK
jgi:hypothetical protein